MTFRLALPILTLLFVVACPSRPAGQTRAAATPSNAPSAGSAQPGLARTDEDDPKVICANRFMKAMVVNNQDEMGALISPDWLRQENIGLDSFMVSRLALPDPMWCPKYELEGIKGDTATFRALLTKGLTRRFALELRREQGTYYVVPGGVDHCCYSIDPWCETE